MSGPARRLLELRVDFAALAHRTGTSKSFSRREKLSPSLVVVAELAQHIGEGDSRVCCLDREHLLVEPRDGVLVDLNRFAITLA